MRLVMKAYKYKLYNSKKNKYLVHQIEIASEIWNFCIAMRRMYYLVYGKNLSEEKLKMYIAKIKKRRKWAHWRKLAYQLIADYAIICIEDLNLKGMQKLWGRKINDIAFGEFVLILEWAASNCGTEVVKIDRFAPSSKCCSRCGYIYRKLTLKQRRWDCPSCGTHHKRDVNAAINICRMGLAQMGYPA